MADTGDWRVWLFSKLQIDAPLNVLINQAIFGAGSMDLPTKKRPFVVIRVGAKLVGAYPGVAQTNAQIWVHDEPGDYLRIDSVIKAIRQALVLGGQEAPVKSILVPGGISCRWQGDSGELADEGYKTIVRTTGYQLNGKD